MLRCSPILCLAMSHLRTYPLQGPREYVLPVLVFRSFNMVRLWEAALVSLSLLSACSNVCGLRIQVVKGDHPRRDGSGSKFNWTQTKTVFAFGDSYTTVKTFSARVDLLT